MAKFPAWGVGTDLSATNLAYMLPDIKTKVAANTITSNATLANDAELQNIALEVGTWEIEFELWVSGNGTVTTGGFKDVWTFSGTLTGTPNKSVHGPASTNAVLANGAVSLQSQIIQYNSNGQFGLLTGAPYLIREVCPNFVVATAGNLALQVAQGVSNATSTVIQIGSRCKSRRII
jgi:hypothetical protein